MNKETAPSIVWVDGWDALRPVARVRTLYDDGRTLRVRNEPLSTVIRRRAFEPSAAPFRGLSTRSVRIANLDLREVYPVQLKPSALPPAVARSVCSSRHDILLASQNGLRLLIPAILLVEAIWLWSAAAAAQVLVPGSVDLNVGRITESKEITVAKAIAGTHPSATTLRRIAWLGQCEDARRSWSSVLTRAMNGRLSLDIPQVRLSGWAWSAETDDGLLVADFNGVTLDFDLPRPDAVLRIGAARTQVPSEPSPTTGFMSFM